MEASFAEAMIVEGTATALHSDRMAVAVRAVLERVAARALQSIVKANPDDPVKALHGYVLGLDLNLARLSAAVCSAQYSRIEVLLALPDRRAAVVTLGFMDVVQHRGRAVAAYGVATVVEGAAH